MVLYFLCYPMELLPLRGEVWTRIPPSTEKEWGSTSGIPIPQMCPNEPSTSLHLRKMEKRISIHCNWYKYPGEMQFTFETRQQFLVSHIPMWPTICKIQLIHQVEFCLEHNRASKLSCKRQQAYGRNGYFGYIRKEKARKSMFKLQHKFEPPDLMNGPSFLPVRACSH